MLEFDQLQQNVEMYFLPMLTSDLKFSHKKMSNDDLETMICYFEKNGEKYQLDVQLEDNEYINILLAKIIDHNPVDLGFMNYLTTFSEMTISLNFLMKLYLS